jgi:hypothetical protein
LEDLYPVDSSTLVDRIYSCCSEVSSRSSDALNTT